MLRTLAIWDYVSFRVNCLLIFFFVFCTKYLPRWFFRFPLPLQTPCETFPGCFASPDPSEYELIPHWAGQTTVLQTGKRPAVTDNVCIFITCRGRGTEISSAKLPPVPDQTARWGWRRESQPRPGPQSCWAVLLCSVGCKDYQCLQTCTADSHDVTSSARPAGRAWPARWGWRSGWYWPRDLVTSLSQWSLMEFL